MVTHKQSAKPSLGEEGEERSSRGGKRKRAQKRQQGAEGVKGFYKFQVREAKMQRLADLRAKFEADKKRVARLRAERRFKPYER